MNTPACWKTKICSPILTLISIVFLIEVAVACGWISRFILPRPSDVAACFVSDGHELLVAGMQTMGCACVGLILSTVVGVFLAILFSSSQMMKASVYPYAVFFQTVPIIAIAPLLVIWFGFGAPTVIASSFIVSLFPMIANTMIGLESTEPALLDLFRIYSAKPSRTLWKLRLPMALPFLFTGLKVASGLAVIGAIVGEFVAGGGLGAVVDAARTLQRIDKVFAAVLMSSLIGLILVGVIHLGSWLALRGWHASHLNINR